MGKIAVGEKQVAAWKLDSEFYLVAALNMSGADVIYKYDSVDGTYQRHVVIEEPVVEPEEQEVPEVPEEESEEQTGFAAFMDANHMFLIVGLAVLVLILAVVVIVLVATRQTKRGRGKARERRKAKKQAEE